MITLEVSSTAIRLMEIAGGRVIKWASRSLEPGMFQEEVVSDPRALGAVVKQLMTSSGINGRNVTVSVSGLYSLSRIVMVSTPLRGSVTRQAVLEAAREVMPLSQDEMYLSWQTIATIEGGQQVLVIGVPRDVMDGELRALKAVGINPRLLDMRTMALARAVNREEALILNIEPSSFDIVVVVNGVPEVMRTTAWQQGDLAVEEKAEHLAVNLELTVGFHNSHHPGFPLALTTPLFITGQMSGDLALMENLQDRVEYPFEPLAPPLEYPEHLPVSQYAVNIGLALKGTAATSKGLGQGGYSLPDMNLLPEDYRPWKPSARQLYFFCAVVAAIALLFPLYRVTSDAMAETAACETRHNGVINALQRMQTEIMKREPLQRAIDGYNTIVNMGGSFADDLVLINSQAEELGVEVQSISHLGSSITVNCQTNSYITFRAYLTALQESGRFSSVTGPLEQYEYVKEGTITLKR